MENREKLGIGLVVIFTLVLNSYNYLVTLIFEEKILPNQLKAPLKYNYHYEMHEIHENVTSYVLIVSTWRSGAGAFLAQMLSEYPLTYFSDEPFSTLKEAEDAADKIQVLKSIFSCNYTTKWGSFYAEKMSKGMFINHVDRVF